MRFSGLVVLCALVVSCGSRRETLPPREAANGAEAATESESVSESESESESESVAESESESESVAEPAPVPSVPSTAVLDSWAELEPRIHGVYRAEVRVRARRDGRNELCATPRELLAGAGPLPARELCTAIEHVLGAGAPWPPLATTGSAVVVTTREGAREVVLGAVPDDTSSYQQALWDQIRCGDLARFWSSIPPADLACARDDECALLTSMCFESTMRDDRSAPYRDVLAAHGVCMHPAAGACAPSRARAVCRAGACATAM